MARSLWFNLGHLCTLRSTRSCCRRSMMAAVSEADKVFVVKSDMASLFDDMAAAVLKDKPENLLAYLVDLLGKVCMWV